MSDLPEDFYYTEDGRIVYLDANGLAWPSAMQVPERAKRPDPELCPLCLGELFDNRRSKSNPKAPDWTCYQPCKFVMWPGQTDKAKAAKAVLKKSRAARS